jgi:hypothetical protein
MSITSAVEPDFGERWPVTDRPGPAFRGALPGLFIHRLTVGEDSGGLALRALDGGDEANTVVTVLGVVTLYQRLPPGAGLLRAGKALGGIGRTRLAGAKQRLGIGIVVAGSRTTIGGAALPRRYSLSHKGSLFRGLPLSACRTRGGSMHGSAHTARRTTSAAYSADSRS